MKGKARRSRRWVRWIPLVLIAYGIGFGLTIVLLKQGSSKPVVVVSKPATGLDRAESSKEEEGEDRPGTVPSSSAAPASTEVLVATVDNLPKLTQADNAMSYQGFPRFTEAPITITPRITVTRMSGMAPLGIAVNASDTMVTGGAIETGHTIDPYSDLHFEWDFGDPSGTETVVDEITGATVNLNRGQVGPAAAYMYRTPGSYTITLVAKVLLPNGEIMSASTTSLRVNEVQELYIGGAVSGTYTLTNESDTTSPIDANASMPTLLAALESLPSIGAGNVRLGGTWDIANNRVIRGVEFCNGLGGQSITPLTLDTTGLINANTPKAQWFRRHEGRSAASITVTAPSETQYFDYENGVDANPGTEAQPRKNWNTAVAWLNAGTNRQILLKRGSTFQNASMPLEKPSRVGAYGTGARPILRVPDGWDGGGRQLNRATSMAYIWAVDDVCHSGIEWYNTDADGLRKTYLGYAHDTAGNVANPWYGMRHFWFDDCKANTKWEFTINGSGSHDFGWYKCEQVNSPQVGSDFIIQDVRWITFLGHTFDGRNQVGHLPFDHYIYPKCPAYLLVSLCDFRPSGALYHNINGNTCDRPGACHHWYIYRNKLHGAISGIDMASKGLPVDEGDIGQVVIARNSFLLDQTIDPSSRGRTDQVGVDSGKARHYTIRDNTFRGFCGQGVYSQKYAGIERVYFYRNYAYIPAGNQAEAIAARAFPNQTYVADNVFDFRGGYANPLLRTADAAPYSKIKRNVWYIPNSAYQGTRRVLKGPSFQTTSQGIASGALDPSNSELTVPPFLDAENGNFRSTLQSRVGHLSIPIDRRSN